MLTKLIATKIGDVEIELIKAQGGYFVRYSLDISGPYTCFAAAIPKYQSSVEYAIICAGLLGTKSEASNA